MARHSKFASTILTFFRSAPIDVALMVFDLSKAAIAARTDAPSRGAKAATSGKRRGRKPKASADTTPDVAEPQAAPSSVVEEVISIGA